MSTQQSNPTDATTQLAAQLAAGQERWVAFVARRVPPDVDAEDLVQRALERALRRGHGPPGPCAPRYARWGGRVDRGPS